MKTELRYRLEKEEIKKIFIDLQSRGYNLRTLMKLIPGFSDTLYRGYTFREDSFKKLCKIYGKHISYSIKSKNDNIKTLNIEINDDLAEIVGILLGDGGIGHYIDNRNKNLFITEISFNSIDGKPYISYVDSLLQKIFNKKPHFRQRKDQNAAYLRYHDKSLHYFLLEIGLKSGNKIKNQVSVPKWIMQKKSFKLKCLKGLFDTDGSIFIDKRYDSVMLEFRNHSQPLLDDFRKMCRDVGINPSPKGNKRVKIQSKKEVKKFLDLVQPFKWLMKLRYNPSIENKLKYKINRN